MNKLGFLLLAAVASKGALASEVGAPFPQLANSTAILAVAIAETGASSSLAIFEPEAPEAAATLHETQQRYIDRAMEQIAHEVEQRIYMNMEQYYTMR